MEWPKETCAGQETIPSIKKKNQDISWKERARICKCARQEIIHQLKRESERLSNCQIWTTYTSKHFLLRRVSVVHFWRQRSCHQDDYQRTRTHRVALDWCFERFNLEPKIQIKCVDIQIQLADLLTKRSFTRDECHHLLRLSIKKSFSMFSCSHFSIPSDPIGKQSAMSKRGQEATSSKGSPMAKPVNLVLRSPWSTRWNPPQDLGYRVSPGNVDEGQGTLWSENIAKHDSGFG